MLALPNQKALPILRCPRSSCGDSEDARKKDPRHWRGSLVRLSTHRLVRAAATEIGPRGGVALIGVSEAVGLVVVLADDRAVRNDRPADGGRILSIGFVLARDRIGRRHAQQNGARNGGVIIISFERFLCEQPKPRLRNSPLSSIGDSRGTATRDARFHRRTRRTYGRGFFGCSCDLAADRAHLRRFPWAKRARADQAQQRGPSHLREEAYLQRMLGIPTIAPGSKSQTRLRSWDVLSARFY
jgi:hypothetical protein